MSEFNNILKNGELSIKDHKQLIHLLNGLIIENKKIFERLPYSVQQQLGFDIYRMKLFKFEQVDDIFAKTLFSPIELGKQVAILVDAFKSLLRSNISLQVHHKVLDAREEQALKEKVNLVKVTFSSGPASTTASTTLSPLVYSPIDTKWWIDASVASTAIAGPSIINQYRDHLNLNIPNKSKNLASVYTLLQSSLNILFTNNAIINTNTGIDLNLLGSSNNIKVSDLNSIYIKNETIKTNNKTIDIGGALSLYDALRYLIDYIRILIGTIISTFVSLLPKGTSLNAWSNRLKNLTNINNSGSSHDTIVSAFGTHESGKGILTKLNELNNLLGNNKFDISKSKTQVNSIPTGVSTIRILTGGSTSINTDPYYEKYIKYKAKYQTLKKQLNKFLQ